LNYLEKHSSFDCRWKFWKRIENWSS